MTAIEHRNGPKWMDQVHRFIRQDRSAEHPFSTEGTALLVIDMQRYFIDPSSHASFPEAEAVVGNVRSVLDAFRARGLPVIFTRHALARGENAGTMGSWWGDVLNFGRSLSAIDDRVCPMATENVVRKTRYSAFVGTDLENILHALNITRLVIVGVMTHLCCESTARDAFMRDLEVFFVVDATATDDMDPAHRKP